MQILDQIGGVNGEELPWEGQRLDDRTKAKMQMFRGALDSLLHRDPAQRPQMRDFYRVCRGILGDDYTQAPTDVVR